MRRPMLLAYALSLVLAACGGGEVAEAPTEQAAESSAAPATLMVTTTALGDTVVDGEGRAVYVFDNDSGGTSSCDDQCAVNWPPVTVQGSPVAGDGVDEAKLGTIERTDGALQVTYGGRPVYHFAGDEGPGDVKGHGVGDKWWLVRPDGTAIPKSDGVAAY